MAGKRPPGELAKPKWRRARAAAGTSTWQDGPPARQATDRLRQEQLERQGWRFHRIWSAEWFHDKQSCTEKAIAAYQAAVRGADEDDLAIDEQDAAEDEPGTPLRTMYEAALSRAIPAPSARNQRIDPRPWITPGQPIDAYSDSELLSLAQWIRSDDLLRTQDELLHEMMRELGFQRRGKNVVARLNAPITWSAPHTP